MKFNGLAIVVYYITTFTCSQCFVPPKFHSTRLEMRKYLEALDRVETLGRPKWAGGGIVSDFINILIRTKPIWNMMRPLARNVLISSAEKNDVAWNKRAEYLESKSNILQQLFQLLENKNIEYPSYYLNSFHGYDDGNLNWLAAYECEQATMSMHIRAFAGNERNPIAAYNRLREPIISAIVNYRDRMTTSMKIPSTVLDVGCSVGVSTFSFAEAFPSASVTGLDLSPHFLAVAKYRQEEIIKQQQQQQKDENSVLSCSGLDFSSDVARVQWQHALAEDTGLPDSSYDLINVGFVIHELPAVVRLAH